MLKYIFILAMLLLAVEPSHSQVASDGYKFFGNPPLLRQEFSTVVIEHESRNELVEAGREAGLNFIEVHAFSTFNVQTNVCTIHIIKPSVRYLPEHIGHELVHCLYGKWHK
jgi:hypothetical protein